MTDLDRLIDALAECIVARQGLPNRDRAKAVLAEIEAQGWRLGGAAMSSHLVERLRAMAPEGASHLNVEGGDPFRTINATMIEAADEIERLRVAVQALVDTVVEMEAYNDVPGAQNDPVWQGIRKRGAEALAKAREET